MALRPRPTLNHPIWDEPDLLLEDDRAHSPSRTQRKQESHALQALGQALGDLSAERLKAFHDKGWLTDALLEALLMFQRTRSFEGRRRQMQYVGKLMRKNDPEPLRRALDELKLGSAQATLALHECEAWRDRLLADDSALTAWMDAHPDTDAQQLRSLVRTCRKDASADANAAADATAQRRGKAYRELFQLIKAQRDALREVAQDD